MFEHIERIGVVVPAVIGHQADEATPHWALTSKGPRGSERRFCFTGKAGARSCELSKKKAPW